MGIVYTSLKNKVCACVFGSSGRGEITTLKKRKTWVAVGEWGQMEAPRSRLGAQAGDAGVDVEGAAWRWGEADTRAMGKLDWVSGCEEGTENEGQPARAPA